MAESGYIYILMNASMPKLLKIGKTAKPPEQRADELSISTGVPTPYHVAFQVHVADCDSAEKRIHETLASYRVNERREFFSAPLKLAIQLFSEIEKEMPFQVVVVPRISPEEEQQRLVREQLEIEFDHCKDAARAGVLTAQHQLSCLYANGRGVPQHGEEAIRWLRIAAAGGHVQSQVQLGQRYESGSGEIKDLIESFAFYSLAARNGNTTAIANRKRLSLCLTRAEMDKARFRASEIISQRDQLLSEAKKLA